MFSRVWHANKELNNGFQNFQDNTITIYFINKFLRRVNYIMNMKSFLRIFILYKKQNVNHINQSSKRNVQQISKFSL